MWLDYAYDSVTGNRTSVTSRSSTGTVATRGYVYPAAGSARPHAVQQITGPAGQGTGSYGYDESGNQVSRPGQQLTFNTVGKVSKVVAGSEVQSNVFDADGNLLLRVSSTDGATLFLGDTTLTQAAGSSVVAGFRTYSGAEGKPVAQRSAKTGTAGSVLTWLFTNLEGTVDVQTTANGSSTVQSYRDPFGAPVASSAQAWADGAGYMNKQVAKATALTNVGARTYDPALGKFVSVDPVIDTNLPQQNTGYAYSGNNPTTYKDPSGLRLTIGCEPYCGKGAATIAQKLTPKARYVYNPTPEQRQEYTERYRLYNQRQAWGDKLVRQSSLLDQALSASRADYTKRDQGPAWGPLVSFAPSYQPPEPANGIGVQACLGICGGVEYSPKGGWSWTAGLGLKAEISVSTGVSVQESAPVYVVGECSASAILGVTAHVGVGVSDEQNSPGGVRLAGTSGGGIKYGGGGGCAIVLKGNF